MNENRRAVLMLLKVCDLAVVLAAFGFAMAVSETTAVGWTGGWWGFLELRFALVNVLAVLVYLGFWHLALRACGLYASYRLAAASREMRDLAIATAIAIAPLALCWPLGTFDFLGVEFVATIAVVAFAGLAAERRVLRALGRRLRQQGRNLRNVVVVGIGDAALALTATLVRRGDFGYRVVAVIDCGASSSAESGAALQLIGGLVDDGKIDEVFMALPFDTAHELIARIVAICEEQGITVRLATQLTALYWARALIDEVDGQPIITVHTGPADTLRLLVKRAVDLFGAAVGLVALSPLFGLCALAIKLESPGPVFFLQDRVGYNRRRFRVFKFRTMVPDAERLQASLEPFNEASGPVFKIEHDPRVTRVGRWLRRTSIDELPQLINVLKGEMSLVGPRPLPVRDVDRIDVRWHRRRFSVKPGITCLWQVESREPEFDEWIRLDMQYIDNWSLALDLKILAKTIPAVLSGQGAH
jgi:exopolysaccharide biosynthesis polyprenyl glycosylphosphotransferase